MPKHRRPNCDGVVTERCSSLADKAFCPVNEVVSHLVDVGHDQGKVQASPKSDQGRFTFPAPFGPKAPACGVSMPVTEGMPGAVTASSFPDRGTARRPRRRRAR